MRIFRLSLIKASTKCEETELLRLLLEFVTLFVCRLCDIKPENLVALLFPRKIDPNIVEISPQSVRQGIVTEEHVLFIYFF